MRCSLSLSAIGITATMIAAPGFAAEPKSIGQYKDWSAHVVREKATRVCYIHSEPQKSVGKYKKRDRTFVQVAHRPAEKVKGEVSVTAGYTYGAKSDVEVEVDGKKFNLFTQEDGAWLRDAKADAALVRAMKRGSKMVVRGRSSRGTRTTDTYSLSGFTAAYSSIGKACS